jgi:hypothetical protein
MRASQVLHLVALMAGTVSADFYFGVMSGQLTDGTVTNPTTDSVTKEIIKLGSQDICDSSNFGGDPGSPSTDPSKPWINWCGRPIKMKGADLILDPTGPCGSDVKGGDTVADGHPYSTILDQVNGNKSVGTCTFE